MEGVARSWGWVLFFGLLTLVIGILVMVWPEATLRVLTVLFGLELILVGIFRLIRVFSSGEQHRVWSALIGILAIFLGVVVLRNIWDTVAVLAVVLGAYWIIAGILDFVMAVGDSTFPSRGFTIFMGIIQVIAGIVVVAWPTESVTVLTWLIGIWFVVLGILGVVMAFLVRSEDKKLDTYAAV